VSEHFRTKEGEYPRKRGLFSAVVAMNEEAKRQEKKGRKTGKE
jgi:hypothetical protein